MNSPDLAPVRPAGSPPHGHPHAHVADLETCLDFINTESYDAGIASEHLVTADDAIAFLVGRGVAHDDALSEQVVRDGPAAWLSRVRAVRTAVREIWDAQVERSSPAVGALAAVNEVLREAPRIELVAGDGCCDIGHRHAVEDPTGEALARIIQPLVDAIAAGTTNRFRSCANEGCRWVFEDTSRGGRRRWCDMSSCGNRAKARNYRSRRRLVDVDLDPAKPPASGSSA